MNLKYRAALPCFVRDPGGHHWPMTSLSMALEVEQERDAALAEIARLKAALATAHTRGAEAMREAAVELAATVYLQMIGWDAVPCGCGNGRIPTTAYRKAVDAYAAAIRALPHPASARRRGKVSPAERGLLLHRLRETQLVHQAQADENHYADTADTLEMARHTEPLICADLLAEAIAAIEGRP